MASSQKREVSVKGLPLARDAAFDIAILDINLGGGSNSAPIADVTAKRGIPFIYASGYGADGVPEDFKSRSVLREPFHLEELDKVVRSLLTTERLPR